MSPTRRAQFQFAIFLILLVAVLVALQIIFSSQMCATRADELKLPHHWAPSTGCRVQSGGKWKPIDQVQRERQAKP